jgi:hypothetical protein
MPHITAPLAESSRQALAPDATGSPDGSLQLLAPGLPEASTGAAALLDQATQRREERLAIGSWSHGGLNE